jgi:predicted nucleic acid-binding protein
MYALDTNLLMYAHNTASPFHARSKAFVEKVMNERDADGNLAVCLPAQVLMEFLNVITWYRLEAPLPLPTAIQIVQDYVDTGVAILYHLPTQLETLLDLLKTVAERKRIFDAALAATLKDHGIPGLYTVNTKDFEAFTFLDAKNPLQYEKDYR